MTTTECVVEAPVSPMGAVRAAVATVHTDLDGLPEGPLPGDGRDVAGLIESVVAAERRLVELRLRLLEVAKTQDEAAKVAATGTDAWVASLTGVTKRQAVDHLWLAHHMTTTYPAVRVAFARGELSQACAAVIVHAAETIPATVSAEDKAAAVQAIVEVAVTRRLDPTRLRRRARRMLDTISPAAADTHQTDALGAEEHNARGETYLRMWSRNDGTWAGEFTIPELHAHLLSTLLEQLTAPRRWGRNQAGESVEDPTARPRGYIGALGDAFCEVLEHLPTDGWSHHGRLGASVMVHLDHQHLIDGLAAAHLDTGADLSAGEARRLACNAGILPAVFGEPSVPLDLGRSRRLFTTAQYNALSTCHDQCAAEGCRRPYAWCEIHHLIPWSDGGRTDLANAVPLCGWHHRRIHDATYTWTLLPTGEIRYRRRPRRYSFTEYATDPRINPNLRDRDKNTPTQPPAPPLRTPQPLIRC